MLRKPSVYDDLYLEEDLLREALCKNLEFSPNGNSINVSSLSLKLRVLTIIMFHNLYPLSSTRYMNLGRALFLHDLIFDVEIDICAHIFHILQKTVVRTNSRICIPFCCLVSRILKLKGIYPSTNESSHPKPYPINLQTLNASIGHSKKGVKSESQPSHSGSRSTSYSFDEKLDSIITSVHDLSTQMSRLASRFSRAPSYHPVWYEVYFSPNTVKLDSKTARKEWELAIPWQKRGDDDDRGSTMKRGDLSIWPMSYV